MEEDISKINEPNTPISTNENQYDIIKFSEVLWVGFQQRFWVEKSGWHHDSNPRPLDLCSSDYINWQPKLALFCLNPHGGTFK